MAQKQIDIHQFQQTLVKPIRSRDKDAWNYENNTKLTATQIAEHLAKKKE